MSQGAPRAEPVRRAPAGPEDAVSDKDAGIGRNPPRPEHLAAALAGETSPDFEDREPETGTTSIPGHI